MRPAWAQLLGILSMKKGLSVLRWMRVRSRYSPPSAASCVAVEVGEAFGIGAVAALAAPPSRGDRGDVGQLHRSFDLAVAGEDLLDQGRARARHAEDEDRVGRGAALARARGEEIGASNKAIAAVDHAR